MTIEDIVEIASIIKCPSINGLFAEELRSSWLPLGGVLCVLPDDPKVRPA